MRERTIVYPHPPSEKTMPPWWTPRTTGLALVVTLLAGLTVCNLAIYLYGLRFERTGAAVAQKFDFLAAGHSVAEVPSKWFTASGREDAANLERQLGPVRSWQYGHSYRDVIEPYLQIIILVHRSHGDDHEWLMVKADGTIMKEKRAPYAAEP